jgi:orotate phosphoribosyltransferase
VSRQQSFASAVDDQQASDRQAQALEQHNGSCNFSVNDVRHPTTTNLSLPGSNRSYFFDDGEACQMSDTSSQQTLSRLKGIIRDRSYQVGPEMKLASGRTSTFYFNMKPTMLHPEGAHLIGTLIQDKVQDLDVDYAGGLEMGAVPIATAIATVSHASGRPINAFFVRKQAKEHGTQSLVEGLAAGESLKGKRVAVVEDVTTTGGSALKAAQNLKTEGADVVCVVTVVDRQEGAKEAFAQAGFEFRALLHLSDFTG